MQQQKQDLEQRLQEEVADLRAEQQQGASGAANALKVGCYSVQLIVAIAAIQTLLSTPDWADLTFGHVGKGGGAEHFAAAEARSGATTPEGHC